MYRAEIRTWIRALAVAAVGLFLMMGSLAAQNLVTNGTFDHDIDGWATYYPETIKISFRADAGNDLPGGSGPGSLEVQRFNWNGGAAGPYLWVDPIEEGVTYTFSGTLFIPDDEDNMSSNAAYLVVWHREDGRSIRQDVVRMSSLEKGKWLSGSGDLTAPAGAVKAKIRAMVFSPSLENETRPCITYFDDIVLAKKEPNTTKQELFVPASASAHGSHGTFWSTTGWFVNKVSVPVELKAAFLRQGQDNTAALESLTSLGTVPANGYLEVKDMVALIGGAGLTGGLYIEATAQGDGLPATLVKATTYTFTPNAGGDGGYGQGVPAVGSGTKIDVTVPGLYQNGAYRTNIGALNTSASHVQIQVRIYGADGKLLASETWTLEPYEQKQVSVTKLGVNSASGGYVVFTRQGSQGSFQAYATVVDQKTGDAVYTLGD